MSRTTPILERRHFSSGQVIMHEGDMGDHAYLIQSGSVQIYKEKKGKNVELARLKAGDIFGETALMFDEARTASVKAMEDCNLIVITRRTMENKLKDCDATVRAIVQMMKERLKAANTDRLEKTPTDVRDVQKLFNDAFKLVIKHLKPAERKHYQQEASPILRKFLDLTQSYIDKR
jgi:CRP-like cAMP-binding protein